MVSNKEKIIAALKQQSSVVECYGDLAKAVVEGDFNTVAEQILSLLQLKDEPAPQLQQANVMQAQSAEPLPIPDADSIRKLRNYFCEHDRTPFEHWAYDYLNKLLGGNGA
jgi:hypothetical protein